MWQVVLRVNVLPPPQLKCEGEESVHVSHLGGGVKRELEHVDGRFAGQAPEVGLGGGVSEVGLKGEG